MGRPSLRQTQGLERVAIRVLVGWCLFWRKRGLWLQSVDNPTKTSHPKRGWIPPSCQTFLSASSSSPLLECGNTKESFRNQNSQKKGHNWQPPRWLFSFKRNQPVTFENQAPTSYLPSEPFRPKMVRNECVFKKIPARWASLGPIGGHSKGAEPKTSKSKKTSPSPRGRGVGCTP